MNPRQLTVLTGAGFSKNVEPSMPSINELTELVLEDTDIVESIKQALVLPSRFNESKQIRNIEVWLQIIEESAAYIGDYSLVLRRQALVLSIERKIAQIIASKSRALALDADTKELLGRLVNARINILTTNYDLIFETAVQEFISSDSLSVSQPYDLNAGLFDMGHMRKNLAYMGSNDSGKFGLTRFFKLHGSCDWYSFNSTLDDKMYIDTTALGNTKYIDQAVNTKEYLKNMSPVIAPPTARKRDQIHSLALRSIWSSAFDALKDTRVLILFGTALHETDASLCSLLIEGVPDGVQVHIFDTAPQEVRRRVEKLFSNPTIYIQPDVSLAGLTNLIFKLKQQLGI